MKVKLGRDKLVVRVLRGDLFELADDDGFFLDGSLDLSYEGGVCIFEREKQELDCPFYDMEFLQ
jgi:hypothetical protein